MKHNPQFIDIEIDKLTNSIENVITGDSFQTNISLVDNNDLKSITKKNGWLFNWKSEYKQPDRDVYKLTISGNPEIVQGLISITEREDHVYMHLIESAPFNLAKRHIHPTSGIKNCRDISIFNGCRPILFICNLIIDKPANGNFSYRQPLDCLITG